MTKNKKQFLITNLTKVTIAAVLGFIMVAGGLLSVFHFGNVSRDLYYNGSLYDTTQIYLNLSAYVFSFGVLFMIAVNRWQKKLSYK